MNKGIVYVAVSYVFWGVFPIYFKAFHDVPPFQTTMHRVVWSFLLIGAIVVGRRELKALVASVNRRMLLIYAIAAVLLAANWGVYVWAVNAGFVVEGSLGYFINPLVSVLLGVVFLREKLRSAQWIPVGLAFIGVAYLTISYGRLPWIALALAFTFGIYGLMKKLAPLSSLQGLALETAVLFLPAFGYLLFAELQGVGAFGHVAPLTNLLLALTGPVTAVPLLFFASGAKTVPLSTMGLLQYIAPTLQFLSGVLLFHEEFTPQRAIGFSIIWLALLIFSAESIRQYRKTRAVEVA